MSLSTTKSQAEVARCWPSIERVSPCQNACPLNVDIPGYVMALAQGHFDKALAIICENNPLPAICAHACHHPCEEACNRAKLDEPIAIRSLKRFIIEHAPRTSVKRERPPKKTKKDKVAVIGSGPAGLAAAHDLAILGYPVTVYEAMPVTGGMLILGIPEFVLPREVLQADINSIEALGIEFKTSTALGKDITLDSLSKQGYKAVFIAVGAQLSAKLDIPGVNAPGVFHALSLLEDINLGTKNKFEGKTVIIGGGNVAVDCARAAIRSGASQINITCLESREDMPAFKWEVERAWEEGTRIYPSLAPQEILVKDGKATGVSFNRVKSIEFDTEGRLKQILVKGKTLSMTADSVIVAIGQAPDLSFVDGVKGLKLSKKTNIEIDPVSLATNLPGVFAGGAIVNVATAVEAIADGKRAATSIDRYLRGADLKKNRRLPAKQLAEPDTIPPFIGQRARVKMPALPLKKRPLTFSEVELGFTQEAAVEEAKRCLNCATCGNCVFGRTQMCYETATRLL